MTILPATDAIFDAQQRLAEIHQLIDRAQTRFDQLRRQLAESESELQRHYSSLRSTDSWLVETNRQLLVSALLARSEADVAIAALRSAALAADHDALTGLPNRALLIDRLVSAIALSKRDMGGFALLFIDLDDFKSINDTLGHLMGDEVLRCASRRLLSCVREIDTVCRMGGDEFVILLASVSKPSDAVAVANKIIAALDAVHESGSYMPRLAASVGVSLYPEHGTDPLTLIHNADTAMYFAKKYQTGSWVSSATLQPSIFSSTWGRIT